jgi:hypothetical protein
METSADFLCRELCRELCRSRYTALRRYFSMGLSIEAPSGSGSKEHPRSMTTFLSMMLLMHQGEFAKQ